MGRTRKRRKRLHPEVVKYLSEIARQGGKASGPVKRRGDSNYYRRLRLGRKELEQT